MSFSPDDLLRVVSPGIEDRFVPDNPQNRYIPWPQYSPAGVRVTHETAQTLSVIFACISVISKALAAASWNVFKHVGKDDHDILPRDPIGYLLAKRPNAEMTPMAAREAWAIAALSWGNGYMFIERDGSNIPIGLWPMPPDRMQLTRDPADWRLIYRYTNPEGDWTDFEAFEILHLKGPSITGLIGDDMVTKAIHAIGLAMAAERFGETYFGNNTVMGGVFSLPAGAKLDDSAYQRMIASLQARSQGPNRAHKTLVLENGMDYEPMGATAGEAQLTELRGFQLAEVCRFYGVPPHKVADLSHATFSNIEHLGLEFVRDALTPWAKRMEQEADYKLFSPRGMPRFTMLDLRPLTQGDAVSRGTYYTAMRSMGAFSVNDVLKQEGMNTIGPEGDIRVVNSAWIKLEDVGTNLAVRSGPNAPKQVPAGSDTAPTQVDSTVQDVIRTLFSTLYTNLENKRAQRAVNVARSEDPITALQQFIVQQRPAVAQNLIKPCELLSRVTQCDTFLLATRIASEVLEGQITGTAATEKLLAQFFPALESDHEAVA